MIRKEKPLAVIYGGKGHEYEISSESAAYFLDAADRAGIPYIRIFIDKNGDFFAVNEGEMIPTFPVRLNGKRGFFILGRVVEVRAAFPVLHGDFGEDGIIQGALAASGIRIFGADTRSGAICSDKAYTKIIAEHYGVKTVPFAVLTEAMSEEERISLAEGLGYPLFVKPSSLGSSIGAAEVYNGDMLKAILREAFSYSDRVLAERLVKDKRELECSYFSVLGKIVVTPPSEVLFRGFYDYEAKYKTPAATRVRAQVGEDIEKAAKRLTLILAEALSVKHIARFDYFLTPSGELLFNEVNTCPGMTASSLFPRALENSGISPEAFALAVYGEFP